jgi:hypothetical protein
MSPRDWLVGQIYPDLICVLDIFRDLTKYLLENLKYTCGVARYNEKICNELRAVVDESQLLKSIHGHGSASDMKPREDRVAYTDIIERSKGGTKRQSAIKDTRSLYSVFVSARIASGTYMTMTQFWTDS